MAQYIPDENGLVDLQLVRHDISFLAAAVDYKLINGDDMSIFFAKMWPNRARISSLRRLPYFNLPLAA